MANSSFVNYPFTDEQSCNHLSDNDLQKTSKIAFFSTKNIFVQKDGLNLGPKFEYSFTNGCSDEVAIANDARGIRQGAVIKEDAVGQLTMMMLIGRNNA